MSDFDIPNSGIAILDDAESLSETERLRVRGVALGEGDITHGGSKKRVYWPREVLKRAAAALKGTKIVDDSAHAIIDAGDIPTQPPISSIIGEVTDAFYQDGVGIVYEGEVDDEGVASLVKNGRVDVSPFLFRKLGDYDESVDAYQAEEILHWRDLAVVATGASAGASIEPAPVSTVSAMSQEALAESLAKAFTAHASETTEPSIEDVDAPSNDTSVGTSGSPDEVPVELEEAEVVDESAESDTKSESGLLSDDRPHDEREPLTHAEDASSEDTDSSTTFTMEFTDSEKALIEQAREMDHPVLVESDVETLSTELETYDNPVVVESEEFEALSENVELVRGVLADAFCERTGIKSETAEALSLTALLSEFENEDGEFDTEALTQVPESGAGLDESEMEDLEAETAEALSEDDRKEVRSLLNRADMIASYAPEHAESLREEAADLAGVETADEISEVL